MLPQENWPNFNQFSTIRPWSKGTHDCANKSFSPDPLHEFDLILHKIPFNRKHSKVQALMQDKVEAKYSKNLLLKKSWPKFQPNMAYTILAEGILYFL